MKAILLSLVVFTLNISLIAQEKEDMDYIVIEGKDTVFCDISYILRSAGNITRITYTDLEKNVVELKKDITPLVKHFQVGGIKIAYVPASASKPNGAKKHMTVISNGKIKVYQENRTGVETNKKGVRKIFKDETYGNEINPIELENGKYYDMGSKKHLNEVLIPYLSKCEDFNESFGADITKKTLLNAINEFNEVCE